MRQSVFLGFLLAVPCAHVSAQSARISGTVTDSVHRAPLADATVLATPVAPTRDTVFHTTRTDAQGRYALEGLQSGRYVISVEHAFTDSIGLSVPPGEVQLTSEGTTTANLVLPSVTTLRHRLCRAAESDTTLGVMLGAVRREDGGTVPGATVVFQWTELGAVDRKTLAARSTRMTASATSDSTGVYRACGLPTATMLLVQAQHGPKEQSGIVEERIGEAGVLVRDLVLGDTSRATTLAGSSEPSPVRSADTSSVHGVGVARGVVLGERARPVAGAQVRLFGTSRAATTDASGEFRLADIPTGTQGFEIVALGYLSRRFRAEVSAGAPTMRVTMSKVAAVLDSVRVTASRRQYSDRFREFDERKRLGMGQYVTDADIERRHPFLTTDVLRQMSGFAVVTGRDGVQTLTANRGVITYRGLFEVTSASGARGRPALTGPGGRACPQLYVDGLPSTTDLDEIPPTAIYGIEVYREGQEPPKYGGFCGVILIWTK